VGVERLRSASEGAGRQIARQIEQAQRLRDDLSFLTERGDKLAERLEGNVRSARMFADQAAVTSVQANSAPVRDEGGQKLRSEAERDLLRALRAAR
jgi:hypothetical protein